MAIHPAYNIHPVRDPGRTGCAGRSAHTSGQTEVVERWKGGRWRFHGLFRAHTSNHVRAFAGLSIYFRVLGDFDEWCGEMYRRRGKKCARNVVNGRRQLANARSREKSRRRGRRQRVAMRRKGERGGKSLDVLSEVFDIPKMICANARGRTTVREKSVRGRERERERERIGGYQRVLAEREKKREAGKPSEQREREGERARG